jgi:hypothetical protein
MRWTLMLGCCLAVMGLTACGSDNEEGELRKGRLTLQAGKSVDTAPECGAEPHLPQCAAGLSCLSFKLDGVSQVRCMDDARVCEELLTCTGGTECVVLLSYPGQVTCSGRCTGSDCDSSVSSSP